jgi:hypothetical protein
MATVTPSDRAGAASAKRPATIPTQRSGQGLRLLVLGTGDDAVAFRERAADAGAELAQRFSVRVTHVVVEDGVGEDDARVVRARGAGLPILGLAEATVLIEEQGAESGSGADEAQVDEGEAGGSEGEDGAAADDVVRGGGVQGGGVRGGGMRADSAAPEKAATDGESVPLIRPRPEVVPEPVDGGPSDVFRGSAFEAMLQFPPMPADEFVGGHGGLEAEAVKAADVAGVAAAQAGIGVGGGEARSVLMDVVSEACACAEAEAEAGTVGERVRDEAFAGEACVDETCVGEVAAEAGRAAAGTEGAVSGAEAELAAGGADGSVAVSAASSVAWALVPLVSLGLLTPVAIGYAAYRLRSRGLAIGTASYALAVVGAVAVSAVMPVHGRAQNVVGDLLTMGLAASWLGGTAHCFMLRRRVFRLGR